MKECCVKMHRKGIHLPEGNKATAAALVPVLVCRLNYEGELVQISYMDPYIGILPQNLVGKNFRYLPLSPQNFEICSCHMNRAFTNAEKEIFQIQTGKRCYHISLLPEENDCQKIESLLGIVYDITKEQRIIAKLTGCKDKLERMQQIAKLGYYEWEPGNDTLFWSDQQYRNFGLDPQAIVPTPEFFRSRVHPEDIKSIRETIARAARETSPEVEFRIIKADGSINWLYARCNSITCRQGQIVKIIGITQDITKKKQSEERIKTAEKEMMMLNQLKTRSDYLNRLLTNDYPLEYAGKALSEFGIEKNAAYCCFVVKATDKENSEPEATHSDGDLATLKQRVLIWLYKTCGDKVWSLHNNIILLMPIADELQLSKQSQLDFASMLAGKITSQFPALEVIIGISGTSRIPLNIRDVYEKAYRAAIVAASGNLPRQAHFDDIGLYKIAFQLIKDENVTAVANNTIGCLAEYDELRGGNLLLTLKCILEDESLKAVAKKLYIHHNTAIWRKHRIEELLGMSLDNMETRVALMMHLKVWELLHKAGYRP